MKAKRLLALLVAVMLLVLPAQAAGTPSAWAQAELVDASVLGLLAADEPDDLQQPVTAEKLAALTAAVGARLDGWGLEKDAGFVPIEGPEDATRAAVITALYNAIRAYELPEGIAEGENPVAALQALGAVRGYEDGRVQEERLCTAEEAIVMAARCVTALSDALGTGSHGWLWRAEKDGTVVYLLGTVHVDRDTIYPFGQQLRQALAQSDRLVLEVDFGDVEDMNAYAAMQSYSDGTTLADHVSPELYQRTVDTLAEQGIGEEVTSTVKPWAVAILLTALSANGADLETATQAVAMDMYVYEAALAAGKDIEQIEGYSYQGAMFDSLSPEYQEAYLAAALDSFDLVQSGQAVGTEEDPYDLWTSQWAAGDVEGFAQSYDKDAYIGTGDELMIKMFEERDANMGQYVRDILDSGEQGTTLVAVGAGHMIGETGIVQQLLDAGYSVTALSVAVQN